MQFPVAHVLELLADGHLGQPGVPENGVQVADLPQQLVHLGHCASDDNGRALAQITLLPTAGANFQGLLMPGLFPIVVCGRLLVVVSIFVENVGQGRLQQGVF